MNRERIWIGALALSAAGLVGLITHESYTSTAIIPVQGDRPTVGFGSTFRDDGTPVKLGDTITPPKAVARTLAHIGKDESRLKACVTAPLHQAEYDAYVSLMYNIGPDAFCGSTLVRHLNAGEYLKACQQILRWDKFKGRTLRGLTIRRNQEYKQCISAGGVSS